jgi:sialic acid synthase SpsE
MKSATTYLKEILYLLGKDKIKLLECLAKTGKQSIMSTGMVEMSEIATAVKIFEKFKMLLHCVSAYPHLSINVRK